MKYSNLPERRGQRRVVFVLSQAEIESLESDPDFRNILQREDATVLYAGSDVGLADPITARLERQGLLQAGTVLVASPYRDGDYAVLGEALDRFSLEKWSSAYLLCQRLGARSVSIRVLEDEESKTRCEFTAGGGRGLVKAKGSVATAKLDKFAAQMDFNVEFAGGPMDLPRARELLESSGLEADPAIRTLIEARTHSGNQLTRRSVTIDLSREAQRTVDAALSIAVPTALNLSAQFQQTRDLRAHYKVTFDVLFSDG